MEDKKGGFQVETESAAAAADQPTPAADDHAGEPARTAQPRPAEPIDLDALQEIGMRAVLALARRSFPSPGARERAIREVLDISPTRYYQVLNALLDNLQALAIDPITVRLLSEKRDRRRAAREGRSLEATPPETDRGEDDSPLTS